MSGREVKKMYLEMNETQARGLIHVLLEHADGLRQERDALKRDNAVLSELLMREREKTGSEPSFDEALATHM